MPALRFALPAVVCLLLYWRTLGFWFRADDFAWLGLRLSIHRSWDLLIALFEPQAQGTIRFLSERAFFLTFEKIFGLNSLPFRVAILLALLLSCWMLAKIAGQLTKPPVGSATAIFWLIQVGLAAALGWLSAAANQVFCALFLLTAFWSFLQRRLVLCWLSYLLGFGTLETMAVFPATLLAYCLCLDRARWKETLPFWVPAVAFAAIRIGWLGNFTTDPIYQMHFAPKDLFATFWQYLQFTPGPILATLFGFVLVWRIAKRDRTVVFAAAWWILLLAPVLPLRDHMETYYLAVPGLALAFLLSVLCLRTADIRWIGVPAALAMISGFVATQVEKTGYVLAWHQEHTQATKALVSGVFEERARRPDGPAIFLADVSNDLFWDALFHDPFRLAGITRVYLAPGTEKNITSHPGWAGANPWTIPPIAARKLVDAKAVVVYRPGPERLADITEPWTHEWKDPQLRLLPYIHLGVASYDSQVRDGWYPREGPSRWMSRRASVELAVPENRRAVIVSAFCPPGILEAGPLRLRVTIAGVDLGEKAVSDGNIPFDLVFPIAEGTLLPESGLVQLELSRSTNLPGDERELGIVFGTIQIK